MNCESNSAMTDDIVTRLRAWAEWGDNKRSTSPIKNPFTDSWATVSLEAADEIERLRTDRDKWRIIADKLANEVDAQILDVGLELYREAVHGE
jgi:hypothetical protein